MKVLLTIQVLLSTEGDSFHGQLFLVLVLSWHGATHERTTLHVCILTVRLFVLG